MAELLEEGAGRPDLADQLRNDIAADTGLGEQPEDDGENEREVMEFEDGVSQANISKSSRDPEADIDRDLSCTTHIMFLADSQLGNFMVKYAVLYGFQRKYSAKVYLFPKQYRFANKIFKKLSIDVVPDELKTADWRPVSYEDIMYMLPCNKYVTEEEFFIVTDWPADNGLQLYSQYVDELRKDFEFTPAFRTRARRYTERFRASPNTTLVGIHVRRGDHILHTWLRHQRKVPDLDYFNKSMQYYAAMFPDVRFVACSDDRRFLLNKLVPNAPFPIYTIDSVNQVHDMALLAACDHTVITVGTFGLFSGMLTGGSIVAASRHTGTRGDPFDIQVNPPGDIGQAFLWN
ncbi:galactoside 2-alpha-L-fucosyltransferase SEC1-like [Amphibalanus amphitrite]|uniref:galactoside 2-alpha-L-fucosyltransferase SEC1-like n=1 Tax=Amphibalanus amphitrite TaxID=1232801 RepID=UPI001C9151D0|nr:galactoside 2-alpha-L-fucosyltransferase SEC1-like [Amphibalanus amphitrite]